ncbi:MULTISPECIES: DoxX family protein [Rhizobium]|uniref:DoxX family protein n=1 Tax=Rhizobium rhododendri TaxID=2506430 RepID=A0ABY8IKM2_9HYPH|nr:MULTISPECIES: DoxX family protein [Rhizobium]MBZ5758131.1 DoxX family protein [Rhizobium sp. VS19-DR96]MBZ5765039.1 DoxX family protein [Rhizobium sp. VS19-DR129.2]MBZ5772582.1 DoxX family protein [Rhizobium sp. VS19-DRK62.2]MBZ5782731.1 DoxX family protein [Rhizobium sp. VS19-DR121]MBZ5800179.1 DoxX family protein [Rhizobium sp. VS19-DR181]
MAFFDRLNQYQPYALTILRIMTALQFIEHGTQKLFAFPNGEHAGPLTALSLTQGILEAFGGLLFLFGLFTRPVAFILCGNMAVAYFMAHAPKDFFPVNNGGDAAILFCFVFLFFVFAGPGLLAVDNRKK